MIEWLDAYGCSTEWRPIASLDNEKAMVCKSVGWLNDDDAPNREYVTIVPHLTTVGHPNAEEQGCGDMTIARRAILTVFKLTAGESLVDDHI